MWAVTNQTPFKADRTFARDRDGSEVWIVALKATFEIGRDGTTKPAEEQLDVCLAPKYFGEPGKSSLRYDMDLVRTKVATDILVNGQAHAPRGRPAEFVDVEMRVGALYKKLRVNGDRVWQRSPVGLSPSAPEPFVVMPIIYERAMGGPLNLEPEAARDPANRVGTGRLAAVGKPVPNLEYPNDAIQSPKHKGPMAGLGAIPCDWEQRVGLAGTYDEIWQKERQPLVPSDFQDAYFNSAPTDQRYQGFLQGGEEVFLQNLSADGVLRFTLPRLSFGFRTHIDGGVTVHHGQIVTLLVEPEERRFCMVWQTALPCHHTLYTLKETVVYMKQRMPLGGGSTDDDEVDS